MYCPNCKKEMDYEPSLEGYFVCEDCEVAIDDYGLSYDELTTRFINQLPAQIKITNQDIGINYKSSNGSLRLSIDKLCKNKGWSIKYKYVVPGSRKSACVTIRDKILWCALWKTMIKLQEMKLFGFFKDFGVFGKNKPFNAMKEQ